MLSCVKVAKLVGEAVMGRHWTGVHVCLKILLLPYTICGLLEFSITANFMRFNCQNYEHNLKYQCQVVQYHFYCINNSSLSESSLDYLW